MLRFHMRRRSGVTNSSLLSFFLLVSVFAAGTTAVSLPSADHTGEPLSDADIRQLLIKRIDEDKQGVGIVVGVLDATGRRIVSYGSQDNDDKRPVDGNTLFEIGSITKVFTALLLADMAQHGEVRLDDPIAKYLPSTVKVPERNGRQITLVDLATHTSGLPLMPKNFRSKTPENPFVGYTEDRLYAFLAKYQLTGDIGVNFEYSNVGYGLLGDAMASRAGSGYEELVETRICNPLGMHSTQITLTAALNERLAPGHSADLMRVPQWDFPVLAGAGALRSDANDLLTLLSAMMGRTHTPLAPAMKSMLAVTRPTGQPFLDAALGWTVDTRQGSRVIWRNGRTGGYRAFIGFAPASGIGIVVLSNTNYGNFGIDDLGLHLLDTRYPLTGAEGLARDATVTNTTAR